MWDSETRSTSSKTSKEPRQLHPDTQPSTGSLDQRRRSARSQKPKRSNAAQPAPQKARQRSNRQRRLEVVPSLNGSFSGSLSGTPSGTRRTRSEKRESAISIKRNSEGIATRSEKLVALRPKTRSGLAFLYGTRLLILGIGISVIAGTILSIWDPAGRTTAGVQIEQTESPAPTQTQPVLPQLALSQELLPLKTQIETAINALQGDSTATTQPQAASTTQPQAATSLMPGLMVVDLDTQSYVDINASTPIAAASTIKFPLLVAFFQDVDAGKIRLDQKLTMRKELIAKEAGFMQYMQPGTQFPALEVATKMITESDNTATNMILDLLGGAEAVNQRFQEWGLTNTSIHNVLPDLQGTNISSPRDMVTLLGLVNSGKLMSLRASDRMLSIMRQVQNNSLLPQGLSEGALIAHKTGDIGSVLADVGLVDMPNGKRYLIAAMVRRPHNDDRAGDLIRQMSQLTYRYLSQSSAPAPSSPAPTNSAPASPAPGNQGAEPQQTNVAQP